jgi:predicted PhzF superfamily epimerase YddE/YHI9
MNYQIFQVDAFTNKTFGGNSACVVPLFEWLPDDVLLKIAKENAVAETAFFVENEKDIHLRWFTPDLEIDLCGHATLAAAHTLKACLNYPSDEMTFTTLSGTLKATYKNNFYYLDFPSRRAVKATLPKEIKASLNIQPKEVYKARDYMLVYEHEEDIKDITINRHLFDQINLGCGGVIVTAKGNSVDFVSRFFTPQATILEDPVTGSAHCTLTPYWSSRLFKKELIAHQLSERKGELICLDNKDRVSLGGQAIVYSKGYFMY